MELTLCQITINLEEVQTTERGQIIKLTTYLKFRISYLTYLTKNKVEIICEARENKDIYKMENTCKETTFVNSLEN